MSLPVVFLSNCKLLATGYDSSNSKHREMIFVIELSILSECGTADTDCGTVKAGKERNFI